jgi:hypothetical protein
MSLSSHDRHLLAGISAELTGSDPDLAGMLGTFAQLTAADEMPGLEQLRPRWRRSGQYPRQVSRSRLGSAHILILLWLLVAAAMISVAVALSGSGTAPCNPLWARACAPTPAATATGGPASRP